jgi:hypothetical protein
MPFFDLFYHHVKNNFLKNYDALLESAQQIKDTTYKTNTIVNTWMYNMNV